MQVFMTSMITFHSKLICFVLYLCNEKKATIFFYPKGQDYCKCQGYRTLLQRWKTTKSWKRYQTSWSFVKRELWRNKGIFISSISTLKTHLLEDFLPRGLAEYAPVIHQRAEKNISAQSSVFGRCELEREVSIKNWNFQLIYIRLLFLLLRLQTGCILRLSGCSLEIKTNHFKTVISFPKTFKTLPTKPRWVCWRLHNSGKVQVKAKNQQNVWDIFGMMIYLSIKII